MYKNSFMAILIFTTVDVYYFNSKKIFVATSFYTDIFNPHTSPYLDEILFVYWVDGIFVDSNSFRKSSDDMTKHDRNSRWPIEIGDGFFRVGTVDQVSEGEKDEVNEENEHLNYSPSNISMSSYEGSEDWKKGSSKLNQPAN